jgi:amino-acid N-acetyltransferase
MKIRKAKTKDVKAIHRLVNSFAEKHEMIPRSLNDLYENLRDLLVCEEDGNIRGACALHVLWDDLAEIRSLAVQKEAHRKGVGRLLVRKALRDAKALGVERVFALTYHPEYFMKSFGFREIDKASLPQKIWGDCLRCHKFPECDETAVIKELK